MADQQHRFDVKSTPEAHFAWIRTRLAIERTLMAWIRTATALIGFGFSIVQFFERMNHMADFKPPLHPDLPRHLGLALIALGGAALAIAIWQYRSVVRYMDGRPFADIAGLEDGPWRTPVLAVAVALTVVGAMAFVSVFVRWR